MAATTADFAHPPVPRRAWLVTPEQLVDPEQQQEQQQAAAPAWVDEQQLHRQTEGWPQSQAALLRALREHGPFDGVLGFSQGATVAAVLAVQQWQQQQQCGGASSPKPLFRFVLLCSGYRSPVLEHVALLDAATAAGGVSLPSLHLFGSGGGDRQVAPQDSEALAQCFHAAQVRSRLALPLLATLDALPPHFPQPATCSHHPVPALCCPLCTLQRCVVRHTGGHHIPTSSDVLGPLRAFLLHQQQQTVASQRAAAAGDG